MTDKTILFDLDGTLADTAPDLIGALSLLLKEQGKPPISYQTARCWASRGAQGIVNFAFDIENKETEKEKSQMLIDRFLEIYAQNLCDKTTLFPNVSETLKQLSQQNITWGIVTNKRRLFAEPLLQYLEINHDNAACLVYGDTVNTLKPSPQSLLYAANLINKAPVSCLYVGDSERDVQAAKAAGMTPVIVSYGYETNQNSGQEWGVDIVLHDIGDIIRYL